MRIDDRRLLQVPMIDDGGIAWFHSDNPGRVAGYSPDYRMLSRAAWLDRFYS